MFPLSKESLFIFLIYFSIATILPRQTMSQNIGGMSDTSTVLNDEVKGLVTQVKQAVEEKTGKTFDVFVPVSYKTQTVAGVNYFVKVRVGDGDYIHVRIYKPLPSSGDSVSLTKVVEGKKLEDEIEYIP